MRATRRSGARSAEHTQTGQRVRCMAIGGHPSSPPRPARMLTGPHDRHGLNTRSRSIRQALATGTFFTRTAQSGRHSWRRPRTSMSVSLAPLGAELPAVVSGGGTFLIFDPPLIGPVLGCVNHPTAPALAVRWARPRLLRREDLEPPGCRVGGAAALGPGHHARDHRVTVVPASNTGVAINGPPYLDGGRVSKRQRSRLLP
jgi:hypothetical protein